MTEETGPTETAGKPKPAQELLYHVESGSGTPVVLLHGYTVDHRLLLPLEPVFAARRGWRRLYVDLPGSGRSPRLSGPVTAEAMAEAVLRFVDKVVGDEPFAVVGISYGGQLARQLIADRGPQVLGAALIAPLVKADGERTLPEREVPARDEALLAALDPADREAFTGIALYQDDAGWNAFRDHVLPGLRAHHREDAAALLKAFLPRQSPESRFGTHDGTHLVVTGRQDHMVGWRDQLELLDHYPHATYAVVDGAGHNVHLDRPDTVHGLLGNWLDTLAAQKD
ncbi:alpha/beta fold hydrolase [Streptomyces sp. SudanB182_2057]|uniref:alpha/beta fold hydrolase n=1 Tax=Streptomyces sp. SudanB182_2057 TaxID=3035281 RepID=UPI003F571D32